MSENEENKASEKPAKVLIEISIKEASIDISGTNSQIVELIAGTMVNEPQLILIFSSSIQVATMLLEKLSKEESNKKEQ